MFKKRIGNDISFTWHIYRKDGETRVPEDFTGKQVEVKLISPLQRPVTITDISIATGVVTFTFKGKDQQVLGSYTAVLYENKGADGMVTIDTIEAVTLVKHSYMEEHNRCENITASSVDMESEIEYIGGIAQVQADWDETDETSKAYIKNKPTLAKVAKTGEYTDIKNRPTFDVDAKTDTLIIV